MYQLHNGSFTNPQLLSEVIYGTTNFNLFEGVIEKVFKYVICMR